ncbi:hypothetical protein SGPA1_70074 [Streptomyces misionensis JCM 4497]
MLRRPGRRGRRPLHARSHPDRGPRRQRPGSRRGRRAPGRDPPQVRRRRRLRALLQRRARHGPHPDPHGRPGRPPRRRPRPLTPSLRTTCLAPEPPRGRVRARPSGLPHHPSHRIRVRESPRHAVRRQAHQRPGEPVLPRPAPPVAARAAARLAGP